MHAVPGRQVACHSEVARRVDAVGRQVHFDHVVVLDVVEFGGGVPDEGLGLRAEHDDAVVRGADADFILGADHAERLDAADFRFLDFEFLVAVVEGSADGGHYDGLPGGHVGRAADNLYGSFGEAEVYGGDVEMVAVGMLDAGEDLADDDAAKAAADALHEFHAARFKADRGEGFAYFPGAHFDFRTEVLLQPFV